jgi:hypothetical protein
MILFRQRPLPGSFFFSRQHSLFAADAIFIGKKTLPACCQFLWDVAEEG